MESASRSPIFSHFIESINGLASIRAQQIQNRFVAKMEKQVDENLLYSYPLAIINTWLSIRLSLLGNLITFFAAFFTVLWRDSISSGSAGLSITFALTVYKYK
jgi:ATP-binding cassette, subfamily C (CFTR/MRP), member 1